MGSYLNGFPGPRCTLGATLTRSTWSGAWPEHPARVRSTMSCERETRRRRGPRLVWHTPTTASTAKRAAADLAIQAVVGTRAKSIHDPPARQRPGTHGRQERESGQRSVGRAAMRQPSTRAAGRAPLSQPRKMSSRTAAANLRHQPHLWRALQGWQHPDFF